MLEMLKDYNFHSYVNVEFKSIGYTCIDFVIEFKDVRIQFVLRNTSIDQVNETIDNFCKGFDVDRGFFNFKTSPEILNHIKQKTLSNTKSVWELFEEKDIYID